MNGGVLCETNAQLPSAPVLKQELITEHYAVTAKRSTPKDKEKEKEKCVHAGHNEERMTLTTAE